MYTYEYYAVKKFVELSNRLYFVLLGLNFSF